MNTFIMVLAIYVKFKTLKRSAISERHLKRSIENYNACLLNADPTLCHEALPVLVRGGVLGSIAGTGVTWVWLPNS